MLNTQTRQNRRVYYERPYLPEARLSTASTLKLYSGFWRMRSSGAPKETRAKVAELQNIRKCVETAQRAEQPEMAQAAQGGTTLTTERD